MSFKGDGQVWRREREGTPGQAAALVTPAAWPARAFVRSRGGRVETGVPVCSREAVKAWRSA